MILIYFYIPFIVFILILVYLIYYYYKKNKNHLKLISYNNINFNDIISYHDGNFYVNTVKCNNFKQLALHLQQELGSIKEDEITIKNLNDIS
jgi:hypothetical protein